MGTGGAAGQFWDELRKLYEAAGEPTLDSLVRLGEQQLPPAIVSDTTLSDWLTGKSVPSRQSTRVFLDLVAILQARAKSRQAYQPRSEGWWQQFLAQAQAERKMAQKAGRPQRPRDPGVTPAQRRQGLAQSAAQSAGRDDATAPDSARVQGSGGVVVGSHATQCNYFHRPGRVAGTAYLEQVRDIAPADLRDRQTELEELKGFCHGDEPYLWLRAGPWAGKSALTSWFALHPPEDIDIVCFFITGRLAAQADSKAFTEALLEQLASLAGEQLPASAAPAARDAHRRQLLRESALSAQENGRRLVLLVDGLDEDRGRRSGGVSGGWLPSIASLLPPHPIDGLRVIVSGRPDPEIPDDVPGNHPLRHCRVRRLTSSPHADSIKRSAREELRRLLGSTDDEQSVLGLVTAARGSLTGRDLEELTRLAPHEIRELLSGVAGRTFARRSSRWSPGVGPESYLLAHEELQAAAMAGLGVSRLTTYRNRLHAWAAGYRGRGWPAGSPEYLFSDYYQLLGDLGDLPRMIECAGDLSRHDRMLDLTGGDAAALAEAQVALDRIAAQDSPDIASALVIACHRDRLNDRNSSIPVELAVVWAVLGHLPRAEALAGSFTDPSAKVRAHTDIAEALVAVGQHEQAAIIASRARAIAGSISLHEVTSHLLTQLAGTLARAGKTEQAADIAWSITGAYEQAHALAMIAAALAGTGQKEQAASFAGQAEEAAELITEFDDVDLYASVLVDVAGALADAGQQQHAAHLARRAEEAAWSVANFRLREDVLARVAGALAVTGAVEDALIVASEITDPEAESEAGKNIALALLTAGEYERAETVACSVTTEAYLDTWVLVQVAQALAEAGQYERACRMAGQAEMIARTTFTPGGRAACLAEIVAVLAHAGYDDRAEAVARSITKSCERARALAKLAGALAGAGKHEQATKTARESEAVARSDSTPWSQAYALAQLADALAGAGRHEQAEVVARSITEPDERAGALAKLAGTLADAGKHEQATKIVSEAKAEVGNTQKEWCLLQVADVLARTGQHEQAIQIVSQAETIARSITNPTMQRITLEKVADVLAAAGQHERAEAVARSIPDPYWRPESLERVAEALGMAGESRRAETIARSITDSSASARALARVAGALGKAGHHEQAETVARSISDLYWQAEALARVAGTLAVAGRREQAAEIASQAEAVAGPLAEVAEALALAGQYEHAKTIAQSITESEEKARIFAQIADSLAEDEHYEQATVLANQAVTAAWSITDRITRVRTLAQATETLARARDTKTAFRTAAAICAAAEWTTAAKPVLLLAPSAYVRMISVLDGNRESSQLPERVKG